MLAFSLFALLAVLKLTSVIDWSWWWVTAPLWYLPVLLLWLNVAAWLGGKVSKE